MYHAMFTKAMILRLQGAVQQSLTTLEDAVRLDPQNPRNLKEVARSLHLLGKHAVALDVYDEAIKKQPRDWELYHNKGLCYVYLKQYAECAPSHSLAQRAADAAPAHVPWWCCYRAQQQFEQAIAAEPHEASYTQLAKVLVLLNDVPAALDTYAHALEVAPENADTLTQVGLLNLRQGASCRDARERPDEIVASDFVQSALGLRLCR